MGLTDYVDDVMDNNNTDFECIIKYSENAVSEFGREDLLERDNIQKVVIAFVAADPKSVVIQNSVELFSNIRERIKYNLKTKIDRPVNVSLLIAIGQK